MTTTGFDALPEDAKAEVRTAVAALEVAAAPVPRTAFRALADETLHGAVVELLGSLGRVLVVSGRGFLSGYDDRIASRLAAEGFGVLPERQRATLALVFVLSVAIPRAEGRIAAETPWTKGIPVTVQDMRVGPLNESRVETELRELARADLVARVDGAVRLGPQFDRLTERALKDLFDELILFAEPDGDAARKIRRDREVRRAQERDQR
ncbi:hypothetical protein [Kutzneria sp. 744]|uniref:hypothetical protein n=1 Tax=Kutzneria sp. (strain 744) TaxID=345341 RepID=UPI0003EEC7CC|nr:hypothetical protein [Kutzneria sp. 744]EWM19162.1 hypothetical protein KUTG_09466 [Kutzneria sp. 744]